MLETADRLDTDTVRLATTEWVAIKSLLGLDVEPWQPEFGETVANRLNAYLQAKNKPQGLRVRLSFPGPGGFSWGSVAGVLKCSERHNVSVSNIGGGWDSFNAVWAEAINHAEARLIDVFAMLHADVTPGTLWLDTIIDEMLRLGVGLCSVPIPIKDNRGIMSCGVADMESWTPWRRWTAKELNAPGCPETFTAADMGYPDRGLLHNNGCWCADLTDKRWFTEDAGGNLVAFHNFPRTVKRLRPGGPFVAIGESEDWWFSKRVHELGIKSCITRKVPIAHRGSMEFRNDTAWGLYEVDEDTRLKWDVAKRDPDLAASMGIGPIVGPAISEPSARDLEAAATEFARPVG